MEVFFCCCFKPKKKKRERERHKKGGEEKKTITKRKRKLSEINTMKVTESGRKIRESANITSKSNIIFTLFLLDYLLSISFFPFLGEKNP